MDKNEILQDYIYAQLRNNIKDAKSTIQNKQYRDAFFELTEIINDFFKSTRNRSVLMPGLRGTGKTTMLYQLYHYLMVEKEVSQDHILYISSDLIVHLLGLGIYDVVDYFLNEFHDYYESGEKFFIFVDEAQYDLKWDVTAKVLFDKYENLFLIFTGSSSLMIEASADILRRSKRIPVLPMNFTEYLRLKHNFNVSADFRDELKDLIFNKNDKFTCWNVEDILSKEKEFNKNSIYLNKPLKNEFKDFLKYGGIPDTMDKKRTTFDLIKRVIEYDLDFFKNTTIKTKSIAYQIIRILSLKNPGPTSENGLSNTLNVSKTTIRTLFEIFIDTHLLIEVPHIGGGKKQITRPKEYYFLSPSLKYGVCMEFGASIKNTNAFMGTLLENSVASSFHILKEKSIRGLGIFYSSKKEAVDFILTTPEGSKIPIEVGIGKKSKRQIKKAINDCKAEYGIVISNTTSSITKDDDILYIPPTIFALI